jgi:hypothetical protein
MVDVDHELAPALENARTCGVRAGRAPCHFAPERTASIFWFVRTFQFDDHAPDLALLLSGQRSVIRISSEGRWSRSCCRFAAIRADVSRRLAAPVALRYILKAVDRADDVSAAILASMSTSAMRREPFGRSMWTSCSRTETPVRSTLAMGH